jgi:hypothetical protein
MPGKLCCLKCGAITVSDSPGGTARDEDFIDVMDVEATAVSRIVTGEWWDEAFNGGFVPTFSMLLGGSPGAGKLLALDTPLPTPRGWTTMGEVKVGDKLFDEYGRLCTVTSLSAVDENPESRDVVFSDGSVITACVDHLWTTYSDEDRVSDVLRGRTRSTGEIGLTLDQHHQVPAVRPIHAHVFSGADRRMIVGVYPVAPRPMRCISVDSPSHLYLAGKGMIPTHNTTWLLQVGAVVARVTGRPTYFISAEQDKGELKMTIDRLHLNLERGMFRVLKKMGSGGSIDEEIFKKEPPGMLILDSVTALCGKDKDAQVAVGRLYKQYSIKYCAPSFLISHMTKEGDLAGLLTLQHDVDAIASFFASDNERSRYYGMPALELHKYRFGPTHKEWQLIMTPLGLVRAPDEKLKKSDDVDDIIVAATKKAQERIIAEAMKRETERRAGAASSGGAAPGGVPGEGLQAEGPQGAQEMPKPPPLPSLPPEAPTAKERAKASRVARKLASDEDMKGKRKTTSKEIRERKKAPTSRKPKVDAEAEALHLDESLLQAIKATETPSKTRRRRVEAESVKEEEKPKGKNVKVKTKTPEKTLAKKSSLLDAPVRKVARRR